jgi:hypothetical protein
MNPFDYVNAISKTKKDLMVDETKASEAAYNPFLVNKALSYFVDTAMHANEINKYNHLDNKLQFHYFLNSIRSGNRFSKWTKKKNDEELELVKQYYNISDEKARQSLLLLSQKQLSFIKTILTNGVSNEHTR